MSAEIAQRWILVVDDEPALANLLKVFLERAGFGATVCGDSPSALAEFNREPSRYSAIVTDLSLEHMSGEELILAARQSAPHLPAVITSGYPHQTKLAQTWFLQKPFMPKALVELLAGALS